MSNYYIATAITTASRFYPRLMIADEVRNATISASTGTPASVQNLTTYSRWTASAAPATITADFGSAKSIDYAALYVTDTTGTYQLEYWNGSAWVAIGSTITRTGFGCLWWLFESVSTSKIRITTSGTPSVAVFKAGASTTVPVGIAVGYEPSLFNPNEKISNTTSVNGQILGTQVESQRMDETLNFDLIDPDWINDTWMPLRTLIRTVGVFVAWNSADFPSHIVYGTIVGDPKASYSQVNTMRLSLKIEGPKHVV